VVARRNDRHRNIDNGTLGGVSNVDPRSGAIAVVTDSGEQRVLDAGYVSQHLEHAYALTGHGAHGATVEWSGVIGRPSDFTREWAYTSLSRARGRTRVHMFAEPTANQREREAYAAPNPDQARWTLWR
jgi:ATP-dependent exoDNAse (exonuclease V) alpha subunit